MPQVPSCTVCEGPGEGNFFGTFSCRCCAAFFRRSARAGRQFACRDGQQCPINEKGMRNSCRACRLQRCLQAGMSFRNKSANVGPRLTKQTEQLAISSAQCQRQAEANVSPVSYLLPLSSSTSLSISPELTCYSSTPLAMELAKHLAMFKQRLRAIIAQQLGLDVVLQNKLRPVRHNECIILDRIAAPLYVELVQSQCQEFHSFNKSQKVEIMDNFLMAFGFLFSLELTVKTFTEREEASKLSFYPGTMVDMANDDFCSDMTGIGAEQQKKMTNDFLKWIVEFTSQNYKPMDIGPLEFAVMAGIILWNCVNKAVNNLYEPQRNALFEELHLLASQHCANNPSHGTTVAVRFGKLILLLSDVTNVLKRDFDEMMTISRVFLDKSSHLDYANMWDNVL